MTTYAPNSYYSAPEVYNKPESLPMEALHPRSPEVAYDPRAYPPEIAPTNAPETLHNPQDFPPEAVHVQYHDDKENKTWEPDSASFQNLVVEKTPKRQSCFKRHWKLITIFAVLLIGGGVGGGVGGVLASKSKSESTLPVPKNAPVKPVEQPSSLSLTTGLPAGTPRLLQQTSVAATSCAEGDRWVFMQDESGNIRAAQYSNSNSSWRFAPEQHNFTAAKLGTSMSASCVNITEDVGLALGTYLSLIYTSPSNAIQQTVLNGGKWKDSPVRQGSKLPTDGSRLSLSTYFLPIPLQNVPNTPESSPPSKVSPRSFSSVATYQNNATLFTIDLDPRLGSKQGTRTNQNLLANFEGTNYVNYEYNIGFACDYNLPIPKNTSHYYTRCFMGDSNPIPSDNNNDVLVRIYDYVWEYPVAEAFHRSNKTYKYVGYDSFDGSFYGTQPFGTDIILTSLAEDRTGLVSLSDQKKIVVSEFETYLRADEQGAPTGDDPEFSKVLPNLPFGATSPQSSTVYVYYQTNTTAIGEIAYDVSRGLWKEGPPSYVFIT